MQTTAPSALADALVSLLARRAVRLVRLARPGHRVCLRCEAVVPEVEWAARGGRCECGCRVGFRPEQEGQR